jgi:beta-glucosidase
VKGEYPKVLAGRLSDAMMDVRAGDMEITKVPLDFLGINYYDRTIVRAANDGKNLEKSLGLETSEGKQGPRTDFGWEVWPDSFHALLMRISNEYGKPTIEITENGCGYGDAPDEHGRVADQRRIDFYRGYIGAVARAIKDGANIRGYHAWSLMDNFEWEEGYTQRFGLTFVDFHTQKRTPKESGTWFGELAASGKLS